MPRVANTTDALLADLQKRLAQLVSAARAEGREAALADVRSLVAGSVVGAKAAGGKRAGRAKPARKSARKSSGKSRKNPWAGYTDEQKLARINKMRKGRGLPPKKSL